MSLSTCGDGHAYVAYIDNSDGCPACRIARQREEDVAEMQLKLDERANQRTEDLDKIEEQGKKIEEQAREIFSLQKQLDELR